MTTDYTYDGEGQFFPYFALAIVGMLTVGVTYSWLRPSQREESTAPRFQSNYRPPLAELVDKQRRRETRQQRRTKRMICSVLGWIIVLCMLYIIQTTPVRTATIYDPYDILGIPRTAEAKRIRSHYKKLSLTLHPDKARPDISNNITEVTIHDRRVNITEAYETLTVDEKRNNYLVHGHPNGRQGYGIGIALPKAVVTEGKYLLFFYTALLTIVTPYMVGKWWLGTQKFTTDEVLTSTAGKLFQAYDESIDEAALLATLSDADEFDEPLDQDTKSKDLLRKVLADPGKSIQRVKSSYRKIFDSLCTFKQMKPLALLCAYLGRLDLANGALNEAKFGVALTAFAVLESFTSISLAFGSLQPVLRAYHIQQCLIQGMVPGSSPLLQLPHFTESLVEKLNLAGQYPELTVQSYMRLSKQQRESKTIGSSLLSDQQYATAMEVADQLLDVHVEKALFTVVGEETIPPESLVQFILKIRLVPLGAKDIPEINRADLEDTESEEPDIDTTRETKIQAHAQFQLPLAHAQYFAKDHAPRWRLFLADSVTDKIVVPPSTFTTFNRPIYSNTRNPTYNVQTLKLPFQAPSEIGKFKFRYYLICDSYIGFDHTGVVTLDVEESQLSEIGAVEDEMLEEASEGPDIDSDTETDTDTSTDTDSDDGIGA